MPTRNDESAVFELVDMRSREECWQWKGAWGGRNRNKRPYIQIDGKRWLAYRLVYTLVHGCELSTEQFVLHNCDNGQWPVGCCNPYHMRVSGVRENAYDMVLRQRAGLTRVIVKAIRRLLDAGRSHGEIAELYGIGVSTVSMIAARRTYWSAEITSEEEEQKSAS